MITEEEARHIAKLRQDGMTWSGIAERTGFKRAALERLYQRFPHILQPTVQQAKRVEFAPAPEPVKAKTSKPPTFRKGLPPRSPDHVGRLFADLQANECHFPTWPDEERFDVRSSEFCGARRLPGHCYCSFHTKASAGQGTKSERAAHKDLSRAAKMGL